MSTSHHRQGAWQWHPPKRESDEHSPFSGAENVVSATECTGLSRRPAADAPQAQSLSSLIGIHEIKPQGNIGKGNPNNDPDEIAFHRGQNAQTPPPRT